MSVGLLTLHPIVECRKYQARLISIKTLVDLGCTHCSRECPSAKGYDPFETSLRLKVSPSILVWANGWFKRVREIGECPVYNRVLARNVGR